MTETQGMAAATPAEATAEADPTASWPKGRAALFALPVSLSVRNPPVLRAQRAADEAPSASEGPAAAREGTNRTFQKPCGTATWQGDVARGAVDLKPVPGVAAHVARGWQRVSGYRAERRASVALLPDLLSAEVLRKLHNAAKDAELPGLRELKEEAMISSLQTTELNKQYQNRMRLLAKKQQQQQQQQRKDSVSAQPPTPGHAMSAAATAAAASSTSAAAAAAAATAAPGANSGGSGGASGTAGAAGAAGDESSYQPMQPADAFTVSAGAPGPVMDPALAYRTRDMHLQAKLFTLVEMDDDKEHHPRESTRFARLLAKQRQWRNAVLGEFQRAQGDARRTSRITTVQSDQHQQPQQHVYGARAVAVGSGTDEGAPALLDYAAFRRPKPQSARAVKAFVKDYRKQEGDLEDARKATQSIFLKSVIAHQTNFFRFHRLKRSECARVARAARTHVENREQHAEKQDTAVERRRLQALRDNDMEAYMELVQQTKNQRLQYLLDQTDRYIESISAKIREQREQAAASDPRRVVTESATASGSASSSSSSSSSSSKSSSSSSSVPSSSVSAESAVSAAKPTVTSGSNTSKDAEGSVPPPPAETLKRATSSSSSASASATPLGKGKVEEKTDLYLQQTHALSEKVRQPQMLVGGDLKEYQLAGLQWLVSLYNNHLNGILADEMGLGKTIQTIALLTYMMEVKHNNGPFLIVVPLSTLSNWVNEFDKWAPNVIVVVYNGDRAERKRIATENMGSGQFNVTLTTYDFVMRDRSTLKKIEWQYIVVDEGHRMKNAQSKFAQTLGQQYQSNNRLLLTGTPLQNSLPELWSLLNFLLPTIFSSTDTFEQWFSRPFAQFRNSTAMTAGGGPGSAGDSESELLSTEERMLIINRLHEVLRPFMLRRVKASVMDQLPEKVEKVIRCPMSGWQRHLYTQIQTEGAAVVGPQAASSRGLNNELMQLRKVCNHPYLFLRDGWVIDEDMVRCSGKFELLDRMLPKLKRAGHRVLMFSQMTQVMTIMQDYLSMRGYKHLRLDGSTSAEDREQRMHMFNDPNSPHFVFLLSTRAGGLGLNLATADTVILFDSDWNPMMDAQAQDRAHRIGQMNEVRVFRLVGGPVEEKILSTALDKRNMTGLVVEAGKFNKEFRANERKKMVESLLREWDEQDRDADGETSIYGEGDGNEDEEENEDDDTYGRSENEDADTDRDDLLDRSSSREASESDRDNDDDDEDDGAERGRGRNAGGARGRRGRGRGRGGRGRGRARGQAGTALSRQASKSGRSRPSSTRSRGSSAESRNGSAGQVNQDSIINEMMAVTEEELEMYNRMDKERAVQRRKDWEAFWEATNAPASERKEVPPRLMRSGEEPGWLKLETKAMLEAAAKEEAETDPSAASTAEAARLGGVFDEKEHVEVTVTASGRRSTKKRRGVVAGDDLTERQFLKLVAEAEAEAAGESVAAPRSGRKRKAGDASSSSSSAGRGRGRGRGTRGRGRGGGRGGRSSAAAGRGRGGRGGRGGRAQGRGGGKGKGTMPDAVYKAMTQVMRKLRAIKDEVHVLSEIFLHKPDPELLPDYYQIVEHPICLTDMNTRIRCRTYNSVDEFQQDFELMVSNAKLYNAPDSWVVKDVDTLFNVFTEEMQQVRTMAAELGAQPGTAAESSSSAVATASSAVAAATDGLDMDPTSVRWEDELPPPASDEQDNDEGEEEYEGEADNDLESSAAKRMRI